MLIYLFTPSTHPYRGARIWLKNTRNERLGFPELSLVRSMIVRFVFFKSMPFTQLWWKRWMKPLAKFFPLSIMQVTDDTLVVFTSDNGGLSTSEGSPTSNLPLKGGKGWVRGGIREPWIIRYPGTASLDR